MHVAEHIGKRLKSKPVGCVHAQTQRYLMYMAHTVHMIHFRVVLVLTEAHAYHVQEELQKVQRDMEDEMKRAMDELREKERARYDKERQDLEAKLQEEAKRSQAEQHEKLQVLRKCVLSSIHVYICVYAPKVKAHASWPTPKAEITAFVNLHRGIEFTCKSAVEQTQTQSEPC
jgi:hypothetical protein